MKISTKGRYALRLLLDLAFAEPGEYISLKDISARQEISDKYSEQIINQLGKAGFVRSIRGARGGYALAGRPEDYTVGMILRLMEGSLAPVACVEGSSNPCGRAAQCVTAEVWEEIHKAVTDIVDNITLADLLKRQEKKCQNLQMSASPR